MKSTKLFARTMGVGLAAALSVALAACSSSGAGGTGNTGAPAPGTSGAGAPSQSAAGLPSGKPGAGKPAIVMGDKNFAEEYILGELYSQALEAKGYKVTLKGNIGSSATIDKALTSGKIQMYPEYTGVIYTELAHLGDRPKSAQATYEGAKKWEEKRGFAVLNPTPFQDADGIATLKPFAQQHGLKTIGDLKKLGSFTYGGPPENKTRYQGVIGMKQAYGLTKVQFKPLSIGAQYQALDQHQVDTIAIFTTDGQLASGKYAVLKDTKGIFGYQQVVPVVKKSLIKSEGPAFSQILNAVSASLTTDAIVAMNKAVQIDQQDPGKVAHAFLQANGFLS
ncbi:MAG TPA: glycine betaine ABC transporter substrate-binding protein [Jatrophihabitans sp.]|nr:glycine betaine ABC transporter substrate-binding protein [Jatrophihabitans sp.]